MKKCTFFSLLVCLLALTSNANAYNLTVRDVEVTEENAADVLSNGKVSYDNATKTLTLNKLDAISLYSDWIENGIPDLTIKLVGENILEAKSGYVIYSTENVTITGEGSLKAIATGSNGIVVEDADLKIIDTQVEIESAFGITDCYALEINNSSVKITATAFIFARIGDITLEGCRILSPSGAKLNEDASEVVDSEGNTLKGELLIGSGRYNLKVAGIAVDDNNAADILNNGKVSYDYVNNVLTLHNATIDAGDEIGIENEIEGLKIDAKGQNSISSAKNAVKSTADFSIIGDELVLTNTAGGYSGIYTDGNLTIDGVKLTVNADWGISGNETLPTLTIKDAIVKIVGEKDLVTQFSNVTLSGCYFLSPYGANFDSHEGGIRDNNGLVRGKLVIGNVYSDLKVAGVIVSDVNADDILENGEISYDCKTNTLKLNNATLNDVEVAIQSEIDSLTIELTGENNLAPIALSKNVKITGEGSLNVTSPAEEITALGSTGHLTIKNTTVTATGGKSGILGMGSCSLTIENSVVKATGSEGSIKGFTEVKLVESDIVSPAGAEFNASKQAICIGEEIITGEVVISPVFDLTVKGISVTMENAADILGDGKATYNSTSKTLTLNAVTLNIEENVAAIKSQIKNLTIELVGENTVNSPAGIDLRADTKIEGLGSLSVTNIYDVAIYISGGNLTIDNTTVVAKGRYAISGDSNETLTLTNANVKANGTMASISDFSSIDLTDCSIVSPENATFNASQKAICVGENIVKGELEIKAEKVITSIENVENNLPIFARDGRIFGAEDAQIYDLLGRNVTQMNGSLKGIFIVKMQESATKIVVR